jgi:hypothetical protein
MVSQATDDDVEYDMEGGRTATATATASSAVAIHDKTDDAVVSDADFDNFLQFVNDEIDSPVPLTRVVVEGKGGPSSSPPRPHRPLYFLFFVAPFATRNDGQTSSPTRSTRAHRLSNAPPPPTPSFGWLLRQKIEQRPFKASAPPASQYSDGRHFGNPKKGTKRSVSKPGRRTPPSGS